MITKNIKKKTSRTIICHNNKMATKMAADNARGNEKTDF